MAKVIKYTARGFTKSNNEYVTIEDEDMGYLVNRCIRALATMSELTASSEASKALMSRNADLYGRRGRKAELAPNRENTIMSVIGGVVNNYMSKDDRFKNDISLGQLPYIEHALNQSAVLNDFEPVIFQNIVVSFK